MDPLANFNPIMDKEFYINGDHNGGVFNHFNHNSYGYCYQNPVIYIDPNGKQVKVTKMDWNKLYNNLDRNGEGILNSEKSLNYLAGKNTNTCAIVMSNTSNKSGYPILKDTNSSDKVRTENGRNGDSGNFILDAESYANYLKGIENPTETYTIKTSKGVDKMINDLHKKYDDLKGVIVYVADDKSQKTGYGATGHADLIYEDIMWDLSFGSGTDIGEYLKNNVITKTSIKVYIWILDYDKK